MSWIERLQEAAYISPESGLRLLFLYENVQRSVEKKTAPFEFPDANGTYVQQLGHSGRRYPMRILFSGANYDLEATAFESALLEDGIGKLEHPIYGTVSVVPFGQITRRDDLKDAANQAILEVTFWDTIGLVFPTEQVDLASQTAADVEAFNAAQAEDFADQVAVPEPGALAVLADKYKAFLDATELVLLVIADTQADVSKQFDTIVSSINRGITVLISQPLALAFQTAIMIQAPARALTAIKARLSAYGGLAQAIFTPTTESDPTADPETLKLSNVELQARDLYASSYVSGSVVSAINAEFTTRVEALTTAEDILDQLVALSTWREVAIADAGEVDTGAAYQALQKSVATVVAFLIQASFSLTQERRIITDRPRTIIDLSAEIYGDISDDQLNFLIDSNDLSGTEILEIPKGRTIVFYI